MIYNTTVTQKGQITLKKELRELLGIEIRRKVTVESTRNYIKIKPVPSILALVGKFKVRKGVSALKAREEMEKHYTRV